MRTIWRLFILMVIALAVVGCNENNGNRIVLGEGVRSDNLIDNAVTRTVSKAFSGLIGEGIEVRDALLIRNDAGILELHVKLYNKSNSTKRFQYKVSWFDEKGALISSKASVWQPASAIAKSPLSLKSVAPIKDATNYLMNTRKEF